jgi:uncharacterized cupin superfamily protein
MQTELLHVADLERGRGTAIPNPIHPEWFSGRLEAALGKRVGLSQFGVNLVTLEPGARSALRHWHEQEDEFVYVLSGEATLLDENGAHPMLAGACAGFPAGRANAHQIANLSSTPATFLAVGTRKVGVETLHYPDDPLGPQQVERDAAGERVKRG